jgi:hypothetical protein
MKNKVVSLALGMTLAASSLGTAFAQNAADEPQTADTVAQADSNIFPAQGTVLSIVHAPSLEQAQNELNGMTQPDQDVDAQCEGCRPYAAFVTTSITGSEELVWLDLEWLQTEDPVGYANLAENTLIQADLVMQTDGSFLLRQFSGEAMGTEVDEDLDQARLQDTDADDE